MGDGALQSVGLWLSIILAAIVLGVWSTLMAIQGEYARFQQSEIDAVEQVREYREWNAYDNTQVFPQDIATLVMKTKGSIEVWVDTNADPGLETWGVIWNAATPPANFTAVTVSGALPVSGLYTASIIKDVNGSIRKVEFRR